MIDKTYPYGYIIYTEDKMKKTTVRSQEDKKLLKNRLNRIAGQVEGIKKMIDDDVYCDDILIQLSAIDKAIKSLANVIIEKHMKSCVVREIKAGNEDVINEITNLFRRFQ